MPRQPELGPSSPPRSVDARGVAGFLAAGIAAIALLSGCGSASANLRVRAPKNVNGGRPVYMLVRAVEEANFAVDSYRAVAARVAAPDDSVVLTEVIYPGTQSSFPLTIPAKGQIAVYFLFRSPTGEWKVLLDKTLPTTSSIELGKDQIETP